MTVATSKKLVYKKLDDDCLLDGQLHPAIRQRLNRIRELPIVGVANLIGVERIDGVAQMVWEFVPGRNLEEIHADAATWERIAREVILAIESLHAVGIVHGAIHERNVIVVRDGTVKLTHVSPLLWTETGNDVQDAIAMLGGRISQQAPDSELAKVMSTAREENWPLDKLYRRLHPSSPHEADAGKPRLRKRSLLAAALVAAMGLAVAIGVLWYCERMLSTRLPLPGTPGRELDFGELSRAGRGASDVTDCSRSFVASRPWPLSPALSPAYREEGGVI